MSDKTPRESVAGAATGYLAFVFDVESIGLHGEAFAVAGGIYTETGEAIRGSEFKYSINRHLLDGTDDDHKWVEENIPAIPVTHARAGDMMTDFWQRWLSAKAHGAFMAVECGWPVEARFLNACIDAGIGGRWDGPYPLHEIANEMRASGMDPMATYDRLPSEMPKHDPLADARQSARLLAEARGRRDNHMLSDKCRITNAGTQKPTGGQDARAPGEEVK